jgi:hypothetical protein
MMCAFIHITEKKSPSRVRARVGPHLVGSNYVLQHERGGTQAPSQ